MEQWQSDPLWPEQGFVVVLLPVLYPFKQLWIQPVKAPVMHALDDGVSLLDLLLDSREVGISDVLSGVKARLDWGHHDEPLEH